MTNWYTKKNFLNKIDMSRFTQSESILQFLVTIGYSFKIPNFWFKSHTSLFNMEQYFLLSFPLSFFLCSVKNKVLTPRCYCPTWVISIILIYIYIKLHTRIIPFLLSILADVMYAPYVKHSAKTGLFFTELM